MFKKLFILFVLFCTSITCVQATEEDKILGVIAVLTNTGLYNAPKWADTFKYKNNIAIRQMTLKNKETAGIVLHHTYGVTKWDVTGSYEFWTMYYGYDSYVYEYQPEIPDAIYRYKLEGNKIYKYDRPETGWEWTIFDFFKFEAEGNLVATYEITDDGTVTKYNLNGEKVSGFRIIDKNNICEYDAEGNIIDYYNMFTLNEYYSKKKSNAVQNTTSTNVNSSAIIPILAAVAKSSDKYDWTKEFNDTSSVTQYNAKGSRVATFNIFGSDITQYNAKGNRSGSFYISGDHITQYNADGKKVATFNIFGSDITQYNAKGNRSGSFYISGDHITQYNADGKKVATFNIFGSDITQYNAKGNRVATFSLF